VPTLREIGAEDKDRLTRFHSRLSAETRYRRYHAAKGDLTRRELVYLTEIDGRSHVAVVAETAAGELAAVARVVGNGDGTAEVAVVVADDCRGQGLGAVVVRAAVDRYAEADPDDVVLAHVQPDNRPAMRLFCDRLGGRAVRHQDGVALVRLPAAARF
jgi:ribosomal protein S18 acetylase RimI-like enzyme